MCLGHLTPDGRIHLREISIHRQAILKELLLIFQDILGDLTQVEIKITTLGGLVVHEGIHQPELDIFIVGGLQICRLDLTHHTTPTFLRIGQRTIRVDIIGIQVIGTTLVRIVSEVQDRQSGIIVRSQLLAREKLLIVHATHEMVGEIIVRQVARTGR